MKILIAHGTPFSLAHGGLQVQIEQTKAALEEIGVETEWLRWWDGQQTGDLILYYGCPPSSIVQYAHEKGIPVVMFQLLTGQGSRPAWKRLAYRWALKGVRRVLPKVYLSNLPATVYGQVDRVVVLTPWEAHLMQYLYGVDPAKIDIVANGVEQVFFDAPSVPRGKWLVCTATITERKRVLELGRAAIEAKTPLWVIGKPYSPHDPYFKEFERLAAQAPEWLRYEGGIGDRARLTAVYREARGFVLLSTMESLSLSALEAAACGCPLLLSDLPWATTTFKENARYCPVASTAVTVRHLRRFYEEAPTLPVPPKPAAWVDIARQLKAIYERVLSNSR